MPVPFLPYPSCPSYPVLFAILGTFSTCSVLRPFSFLFTLFKVNFLQIPFWSLLHFIWDSAQMSTYQRGLPDHSTLTIMSDLLTHTHTHLRIATSLLERYPGTRAEGSLPKDSGSLSLRQPQEWPLRGSRGCRTCSGAAGTGVDWPLSL